MEALTEAVEHKDLNQIKNILKKEINKDVEWGDLKNKFWLDLFFIHESFLHKKMGRRPNAKHLAKQMSFLSTFVSADSVDLGELVTKPTFFVAALMLGDAQPSNNAASFVHSALHRHNLDKNTKVMSLLMKNKIITKSPFTLADAAQLLRAGQRNLLKLIFGYDPDSILSLDSEGNNIIHLIAGLTPARSIVTHVKHLKEIIGSKKVVELLTKFNHKNQMAVQEVILSHSQCLSPRFSLVIAEALEQGCKTGDLYRTEKLGNLLKLNAFYLFFIVNRTDDQHLPEIKKHFIDFEGVPEKVLPPPPPPGPVMSAVDENSEEVRQARIEEREREKSKLLEQAIRFDARRMSEKTSNTETRPLGFTDSDSFPIHELPRELIDLIMRVLPGSQKFNIFNTNKALFGILKKTTENYWRSIHEDYFLPTVHSIFSYKKRCLREYSFKDNWKINRCHDIILDKKRPLKMDENWLLLEDGNSFYWWNCHTQQLSGPKFKPTVDEAEEIYILPNYQENQIPSYITVIESHICVVTDDQVVQSKTLPKLDYKKMTVLKDNRVVISERRKGLILYDYVQDKIIASLEYKGHFAFVHDPKICYNISANLLVRIALKLKFYNAETLELVHATKNPFTSYCTLIATGYSDFAFGNDYGFGFFSIDDEVVDLELVDVRSKSIAWSLNRLIIWNEEVNIIMCWNIVSQQYEWIQPSTVKPVLANTRYWIGTTTRNSTVIYDYHVPSK